MQKTSLPLLVVIVVVMATVALCQHPEKKTKASSKYDGPYKLGSAQKSSKRSPRKPRQSDTSPPDPSYAVNCTDEYKRNSINHTGCLPVNPSCQFLARGVNKTDQALILRLHNELRSKVVQGKFQGKDDVYLPPGNMMLTMVWDDELASLAQRWADQCSNDGGDRIEQRSLDDYRVGQFVIMIPCYNENMDSIITDPTWENVFNMIVESQRVYLDVNNTKNFTLGTADDYVAQFMWDLTWRVGCGRSVYADPQPDTKHVYNRTYVCNYGPRAYQYASIYNFVDNKTQACGGCPINSCCGPQCNTTYPALCTINENDYSPVFNNSDISEYFFYCGFDVPDNCTYETAGDTNFAIKKARSDPYMRVYLHGGETFNLTITQPPISSGITDETCLVLMARTGANVFGDLDTLKVKVYVTDNQYKDIGTESASGEGFLNISSLFEMITVDLYTYSQYQSPEFVRLSLVNPPGSPRQFFDLNQIFSHDNTTCRDIKRDKKQGGWSRMMTYGRSR